MPSSAKLLLASCAATSALAANRHTAVKFLSPEGPAPVKLSAAKSKAKDPNWDGLKVQNEETYTPDYVADESPAPHNVTNATEGTVVKHEEWPKRGRYTIEPTNDKYGSARQWAGAYAIEETDDDDSGSDITSSIGFGHSPQWYVERCEAITAQCQADQDASVKKYERDLSDLEAEYRRQLRILDGKEADHADEVADVKHQKKAVKKQKMKVEEAKEAVAENAHCPPELQEAKEKLYELEATPNKTPEDIEAECEQKKIVMEKEKCVEILREAEAVLAGEHDEHAEEKHDLKGEKADEADAAAALPPQEKRVADAKAAWEAAKKRGPRSVTSDSEGKCKGDKDALLDGLLADLKALEEEYRRQKRILAGKEDDHADEQADVAAQEDEVAKTRKRVKEAKVAVKRNAHCPPELEEAKAKLEELEAIPNESPEDIEDECKAKKVVLEKEQCVEVLREAESVLRENHIAHKGEKNTLEGEEYDEQVAEEALPPQEKKVAKAKAALDAARAALEALKNCINGGKSDGKDSKADEAPEPEQRSGAVRAVAGTAVVVVATILANVF